MVDVHAITCPCACHGGGPYTPCTVSGGCGHLHVVTHRCRRAGTCAEWEYQTLDGDGQTTRIRVGAPINAEDGLCLACTRHTQRALNALPRDYTELHQVLGATDTTAASEPVSRSRELPVPIRLHIEAVLTAMVTESVCWAEAVAEAINVTWDSTLMDHHTRPGVALQRATRLLAGALSPLLAVRDWTRMVWAADGQTTSPDVRDGVTGAITLLELHQQARSLLGLTRLRHRLPATCPTCERVTLVRDDGDDHVWCTACGAVLEHDEYHGHVGVLAAAASGGVG